MRYCEDFSISLVVIEENGSIIRPVVMFCASSRFTFDLRRVLADKYACDTTQLSLIHI